VGHPATPPYWSSAAANLSLNNASPLCHDGRDQIVAQYGQYTVLDAFFQYILGGTANNNNWPRFTPNCFEFTNSAASANFPSFSAIAPGNTYALIKNPLVVPASSGYGLDEWVVAYKASRIINSSYRTPQHNQDEQGRPGSRHMFGDAVDLRNETCPSSTNPCTSQAGIQEWVRMVNAAGGVVSADLNTVTVNNTGARASWIEPRSGHCGLNCTHADWRSKDRGKYAH